MDALKADNDALKQSSHPPKGKGNDTNKLEQLELENEVLNEQINELKAQLYMSSAMGDDEWFKNSATRHEVMRWACGLQFTIMLTALLEMLVQIDERNGVLPDSALKSHGVACRGRFWIQWHLHDLQKGLMTTVSVDVKEYCNREQPPSASPFEIEQTAGSLGEEEAGKPEHAKIQRVTTNDVKRELSFKRRQRQSGPMPTEETLAASKMHMLKKNPFEEQFDAASKKGCIESCADGMKMMFSFSADSNEPFVNRIAGGVVFKTLAMIAIVANAVYLGWAADQNVRNSWRRLEGTPKHSISRDPDIAFFCWFAVELLIRLAAERLDFVAGDDAWWNLLDCFLVAESFVTLVWDVPSGFSFLRILRVFRLIRIVRLVRTVQALRKLRTMIFAMINSLADLLWALQVVFLIVFVFSLVFNNAVAAHFDDIQIENPAHANKLEDAIEVNKYYGTLFRSMVSLWSAVSGGNDWYQYAEVLHGINLGDFYFLMFNFYIAFCVVGLFNVVTGVFVDSAVCTRTEDEIVQGYLDEMRSMTESIKGFLKKADKDASGTLTYEEFQAHMANPVVKAYFSGLDIDPDETKIIFTLLDSDCNGDIDIEEFVHGTMKLKGYAAWLECVTTACG
ncbi:Scn11a [Symbiodinium sp. CCMP2592]|nr:Scn11a [Symbiodinium sp. CCMP2592]